MASAREVLTHSTCPSMELQEESEEVLVEALEVELVEVLEEELAVESEEVLAEALGEEWEWILIKDLPTALKTIAKVSAVATSSD